MDNPDLQWMAQRIKKFRLELPAILLLEMHKPLDAVLKEAVSIGAPLLTLLFGKNAVQKFGALCADSKSMDTLIAYLEEK